MKIIFYSYAWYVGGMENVVYNLCRLLKQSGDYDITIAYFSVNNGTNKMLGKLSKVAKIECVVIGEYKCDLLINCSRKELDLPFIKADRIIHWFSSCLVENIDKILPDSKVISQSVWHKKMLLKLGLNSTIIGNPLDVDLILELSNEQIDFKRTNNETIYLIVARISHEKGFDRAIDFMVKRAREHCRLIVIGEASNKNNDLIRLRVEKALRNKVLFLGAKENPYPYIKMADFVCCFSDQEIYGLVSEEAHILGKPVIFNQYASSIYQFINGFDYWTTDRVVKRKNKCLNVYKDQNIARFKRWKEIIDGKD